MSTEVALTSRHWNGECPGGMTLRLKFTEVKPGQFAGQPYEPRDVPCWASCPPATTHTLHPCTAQEYEADDEPDDDDEFIDVGVDYP